MSGLVCLLFLIPYIIFAQDSTTVTILSEHGTQVTYINTAEALRFSFSTNNITRLFVLMEDRNDGLMVDPTLAIDLYIEAGYGLQDVLCWKDISHVSVDFNVEGSAFDCLGSVSYRDDETVVDVSVGEWQGLSVYVGVYEDGLLCGEGGARFVDWRMMNDSLIFEEVKHALEINNKSIIDVTNFSSMVWVFVNVS